MRNFRLYEPLIANLLSPIAGALSSAISTAERLHRARRARAEINSLLAYSDRMLSDIGVSRSDVESALLKRWDQDPSRALASRRNQR